MVRTVLPGHRRRRKPLAILHFADPVAKLTPRPGKAMLAPVTLEGTAVADPVQALLPDPHGRFVIAWPQKGAHYYLISTKPTNPPSRRWNWPRPLEHPCLAEGFIYGVAAGSIEKIDVTRASRRSITTSRAGMPSSLAVLPSQQRAYFGSERTIQEVHLVSGAVNDTKLPGQVVVADPSQLFVFSYLKPERAFGGGHITVNGKPIYFHPGMTDWVKPSCSRPA